jgi:cytochrome c biogenesis protein CcdA
MVETLTPAVCGGRSRRTLAILAFAAGALLASAGLGALLGLAGRSIGGTVALVIVAALAVVVAAREAGLVRFPVPQVRRQVPERWRRSLPLPLWSFGYGAGLGVGLLTHQPVATLWIAVAGAVALGSPVAGAACLAVFGLGRAVMVVLPQGGRGVAWLSAHRGALRPANAAALVLAAALVGAAPAAAAPLGELDPSVSGSALAYTEINGEDTTVAVRDIGSPTVQRFPGGHSPSVDGPLLAFADPDGILVVEWRTGAEVARLSGPLDKPALSWPRIAFVRTGASVRELVLADISTGRERVVVRARSTDDLGRPALRAGRLAWHLTLPRDSRLMLWNDRLRGRPRVVARSRTAVHANPSLTRGHILWVEQRAETSRLRLLRIRAKKAQPRTIVTYSGRNRLLWTTALSATRAYVTAWSLGTGRSRLVGRRVVAP